MYKIKNKKKNLPISIEIIENKYLWHLNLIQRKKVKSNFEFLFVKNFCFEDIQQKKKAIN